MPEGSGRKQHRIMTRKRRRHTPDQIIRKLAEGVIRDQEKEVVLMRDWLKKNGK